MAETYAKTESVNVAMTPALLARLDEYRAKREISRAETVRRALDALISADERKTVGAAR